MKLNKLLFSIFIILVLFLSGCQKERELIAQHTELALDWAECRDEYYSLYNKSNNLSSEEYKRTFSTNFLPKNQECVTKLKLLQQFLKDNKHDLSPLMEEENISLTKYINTLEVKLEDFDSKNFPLLIQNRKLAEPYLACKQEISDDIIEYSEDPIASIENGDVGQLLMDISMCKGRITAFKKFLTNNEELIVIFEGTAWNYYELIGSLEAIDGQFDTIYNEFSEAKSLYYNS